MRRGDSSVKADRGGEPEDVDRHSDREDRIHKAGLEQADVDSSAGSVEDEGESEADHHVVPQYLVGLDTLDVEVVTHGEVEHPQ